MRWSGCLSALASAVALVGCGSSSTHTVTQSVTVTSSTPSAPSTTIASSTGNASSAATSSSAVAMPVFFEGVVGAPRERPPTLALTADGTLEVTGVQWSSWGGATATGTGTAEYHGCTPSCAQGTDHQALVSVRLTAIRACSGRSYYAGLSLSTNSGSLLDESFVQRSWSPC